MRRRRLVRALVALSSLLAACSGQDQLHGVMVDPPRDVAAFTFTMSDGRTFSTAPEAKKPMVLFFGYTHCPDVCPTTMADWKRAKQKLGPDGDRVRFVFVSVDPERDSPLIAEKYAKQFDTTFVGLSGSAATTTGIMAAFGASAAREGLPDNKNYSVSHSAQAFLVDSKGRLVAMYPFGIGWDALAADLETIL